MTRQAFIQKAARVAALRAESTGQACKASVVAADSALELQVEPDEAERAIARAQRGRRPDLGAAGAECGGAAFLAASVIAYAVDRQPSSCVEWQKLIAEVLADAGVVLDDEDGDGAIRCVVDDLRRKHVLATPVPKIEQGSLVLAVLAEDDDWHEAVVQSVLGEGRCRIVFLEYGKSQEAAQCDLRLMDDVVDDDSDDIHQPVRLGECEMCSRQRRLSFHHLIPKDVHPTYLKKRLPAGVSGEPTRSFLNSYGTMLCRQCHSYVHRLAPNTVLAKEYNTLEKILDHPAIQRWVTWAGQHADVRV
mmetsp:Transcript_40997/g.118701  ORF Transcript_40997/g.118701 Transcript_40997/m.118701 type:complete len:304 (+) Transcript_40997:96-1007(+)